MNKKDIFLSMMFALLIILYVFFLISPVNNQYINYSIIVVIALLIVFIIYSTANKKNIIKSNDKIFELFVNASDTLYIIMSSKNKKIVYLSKNADKILNINTENKTEEEIVFNILNIDSIKKELNAWDKKNPYVSQMFEYHNKKDMWMKIKLYSYVEKEEEYYVIEIIDSTKEHDRQHLLITQASSIKLRESQLNEITKSSYDFEIDVDIFNNKFELKYFKKDIKYFGEESSGSYSTKLDEIIEKYINKNDIEVLNILKLNELKNSFSKFELDTKTIRYRIGNEEKNNTWLESTIFYLSNRNNNKVTILTKNVTEDANEIRKQNVILQNALNDLKKADKNKTELIRTISHDVRTPLTNILGLSDDLLNKKINEEIKEDIKNINESSIEMLDIIDGLLDVNDIDKVVIKEYNIFKIFNKVVNSEKEFAKAKNIELNLNMDTNLPVVLEGDPKRLTKVIREVIDNSIKYTEEGSINVNVRGEKKNDNVNLIITVKDTGVGISNKELNELMSAKDNTGYGEIKKIVDSLGGSFEIESKEKEFTIVTLNITQKIIEDNKIREKLEKNKQAETFDLSNKKILIVDDNKLNLKVTEKLLSIYNPKVTLVQSGQEALEKINDEKFDLILLDQMMPGMSGTDVLNKLKENENFNTPVVVLTADVIDGQKEKYLSEGFDDFISKPIDRGELSIVLKKFLKK